MLAIKVTFLLCTIFAQPQECDLFKFEHPLPEAACDETYVEGVEIFGRLKPHWKVEAFTCKGTEQA